MEKRERKRHLPLSPNPHTGISNDFYPSSSYPLPNLLNSRRRKVPSRTKIEISIEFEKFQTFNHGLKKKVQCSSNVSALCKFIEPRHFILNPSPPLPNNIHLSILYILNIKFNSSSNNLLPPRLPKHKFRLSSSTPPPTHQSLQGCWRRNDLVQCELQGFLNCQQYIIPQKAYCWPHSIFHHPQP